MLQAPHVRHAAGARARASFLAGVQAMRQFTLLLQCASICLEKQIWHWTAHLRLRHVALTHRPQARPDAACQNKVLLRSHSQQHMHWLGTGSTLARY